jgi:myo-inositol-1(or 4)-monophosphatase
VHDPIREETFVAERGRGARLNDEGISVSEADELVRALVVTGFPYDRDEVPEAVELFGRFSVRAQGMRRLGSAALDICFVAAGRLDAYYERGIHAWDVAAASLILREAGGRITDYGGRPFEMEGGEMVASNGSLHPALVELTGDYAG